MKVIAGNATMNLLDYRCVWVEGKVTEKGD